MKRLVRIAVYGLLGAAALIPLAYIAFLLGRIGPEVADPDAVLARGQAVCDPIVAALAESHRRHGRYPRDLAALAAEGLIAKVPELPVQRGTWGRSGPDYAANDVLDVYLLSYGYKVADRDGPGDRVHRSILSDDPRGWTTNRPDRFEDLVADRFLARYRRRRDGETLGLFMLDVVARADCEHLTRRRVVGWIGEGVETALPDGIADPGRRGHVYRAPKDPGRGYCLVYKDRRGPGPRSSPSGREQAGHPEGPGSRGPAPAGGDDPVLDKLLLVREADGKPAWTVLRACPGSPRDTPSGRPAISPDRK